MFESLTKYNETLDRIAALKGPKEKVPAMAEALEDACFRLVVRYALDPFMTYGIKEPLPPASGVPYSQDFFAFLEALKMRELTGSEARMQAGALIAKGVPATLMTRMLHKDLKCGMEASSVNKACKDLIPEFPYMRCSLPKQVTLASLDWKTGVFVDEKADGQFTNVNHTLLGEVALTTRQGQPLPMERFMDIENDVLAYLKPGTQTHGEMLVEIDGVIAPRAIGNGIINKVCKGGEFKPNQRPVLALWDQISLTSVVKKGRDNTPYYVRRAEVLNQVRFATQLRFIRSHVAYSEAEMWGIVREYMALGLEGGVAKDAEGPWYDGTSKFQIKVKAEFVVELELVGFVAGDKHGKNADTFGSVRFISSDDLLQVNVSGIPDDLRKWMSDHRDELPGTIWAVKANDVLETPGKPASLFHPALIEQRHDKAQADSLQRCKDQLAAARLL